MRSESGRAEVGHEVLCKIPSWRTREAQGLPRRADHKRLAHRSACARSLAHIVMLAHQGILGVAVEARSGATAASTPSRIASSKGRPISRYCLMSGRAAALVDLMIDCYVGGSSEELEECEVAPPSSPGVATCTACRGGAKLCQEDAANDVQEEMCFAGAAAAV